MQKLSPSDASLPAPTRSRGRPRAFDRAAALLKATHLFWAKGYEATSISDLTEAMGIGSPSLYSAFGSKEALYAEALAHYASTYDEMVWAGFFAAGTAREAVEAFLRDSARVLTGGSCDIPRGCMVTLSSVGSEGHAQLGELVQCARAEALVRLKARLRRAVDDGEIAAAVDVEALARFVQIVQYGMSILARDGVAGEALDATVDVAMAGFDARVGG
ncbi:TetR/AcrR family transcriptional regulator [Pigmentiphaga litoralis]|uniref:TetR/AcrR family transcriptional regulator n=1 Tax=Pigmentiphaga litoralis TaxID=516702 RepID=UPI003B42995A